MSLAQTIKFTLAAGILAAVGCDTIPQAAHDLRLRMDRSPIALYADTLNQPAVSGQPRTPRTTRTLALDSPRLHRLNDEQPGDVIPWYASRNDQQPTVIAGVRSPTFENFTTYTYDRQWQSGSTVRDHYHSTSYRVRTGATAR